MPEIKWRLSKKPHLLTIMSTPMNRRQLLKFAGAASFTAILPSVEVSAGKVPKTDFRFCLNTSTISGQNPGMLKSIEIASKAGYSGMELWIRDVQKYLIEGNSLQSLKNHLDNHGITVENAIGFAPWLTGQKGMEQMKQEMEMMKMLGCKRIAATVAGVTDDIPFDLFEAGKKFRELLEIGRQTGVAPMIEFWGASKTLWHIGQAMMIASVANHPNARILADVYHLFRGDSGYDCLKMLKGNIIELFHMNDYTAHIPREKQTDADRVYPGDGIAPMKQILTDLKNMGGTKVLSLELFNKTYWSQPADQVAKTGLEKMKRLVAEIE